MYNNYGVKIFDDNESDEDTWATFCSSDYSSTTYDPKLVITYYTGSTLWTRYNHGYNSSSIAVDNDCSLYSTEVYGSISAWNQAGDDWNIYISTSSPNKITEEANGVDEAYALYTHYVDGHFTIALNTTRITYEKEWDTMAQSVIVPELGHALWLEDRENDSLCIMGYDRNRNILIYPTASDSWCRCEMVM